MANVSLDDSVSEINFSLSLDQYDCLLETSSKANSLTQFVLAVTDLDLAPTQVLRNFIWALDDMLYQLNRLCHQLKPRSPINTFQFKPEGQNHD